MTKEEIKAQLEADLERSRSKVRRYLSYGAGALFFIIALWGVMWMTDRSITMVAINSCVAIIFYWFGQRSGQPPQLK